MDNETIQEQSVIIIEFALGSAEPQRIECRAVSPGQMHSAARRLQLMGDRHVLQMVAAAEVERMQQAAEVARVQQMIKDGMPIT